MSRVQLEKLKVSQKRFPLNKSDRSFRWNVSKSKFNWWVEVKTILPQDVQVLTEGQKPKFTFLKSKKRYLYMFSKIDKKKNFLKRLLKIQKNLVLLVDESW